MCIFVLLFHELTLLVSACAASPSNLFVVGVVVVACFYLLLFL